MQPSTPHYEGGKSTESKGETIAKRTTNPEELKRRKAQKKLEALDYTPLAARFLSGILRELARQPKQRRDVILRLFNDVAQDTESK